MTFCFRMVARSFIVLLTTVVLQADLFSQITIKLWNPLGSDKNWETGTNWIELSFPPSPGELAEFRYATDSVHVSSSQSVTGIHLNGGIIAGTGSISVSDSMNVKGGKLVGSGSLTIGTNATVKINDADFFTNGWNVEMAAGTSVTGSTWLVIGDTLVISGTVSIAKLELTSTSVVTGTGVLEITDSLKWSGGTFSGSGTLRILAGAVAKLASNGGTLSGWTLENNGDFHQEADLTLASGIVANNGSYVMGASINNGGGTNSFTNAGTLSTGTGAGSINVPFNTTGTVNVVEGSVSVKGGGTAEGEFTITSPMSISFSSTPYAFASPSFSGTGWTIVDVGVTATGTTTISKFDFSGYTGSLSGAGTVQVTDSMLWGAGELNGPGELIIAASAILTIPPDIDSYLNITNHTLTNNGTVIQSYAMNAGGNAVVTNNGTYRIENMSVYNNDGTPSFNNAGQLEFSDLYGFAAFQASFNNTGSVEIQQGTLPFSGGGSNSGTFSIAVDTAAVEIPSGVFTLSNGTDVSGPGFFRINGGTVTLDGAAFIDKLAMDSGLVEGNGNLTVRDTLLWGGGTFGGAGDLIIAEDAFMSITAGLRAASRVLDARHLNNLGRVVQWANYDVAFFADILNVGMYDLMGNHVIVAGTTPGIFHNTGTLNKLAGPPNGGTNGRIEITLVNDSSLFIDGFSSLELSGGLANFVDNALSGGTFTIAGTLTFPGAAIDTNNATLTLAGGNILNESGNPALAGLALNKGTFEIENSLFSINTHVFNEGTFIIQPGCSLNVQGYTQTAGTTYFRSGSSGGLNPGEGGVDIQGGTFYGKGDIYGSLANSADLFIGEEIGRLSVSSFFQSPEGVLHVDIGGTSPAENHDQLRLPTGLATLDGTVKAKLVQGFVPDAGNNVFAIVEHEGRDSTFDAVVDLDPGDGIRLIGDYASNAVTNLVANFAPVFTQTLPDTTIDENETLTFSFVGEDPEEGSVFYSLVSLVAGTSIDSANGNFSWTPNYDQSGVHEIILSVSDAFETTLDTVVVTVLHVNRAPLFSTGLPDTTVAESQELQFSILGADLDLDVLSYHLEEGPLGASVDSASGLFSWTPSYSDSGSHRIIISLTDGLLSVADTAWIEVTNTNVLPVFVADLPDTTILENSTLLFSLSGSDFDLNALTFAKVEGPAGLTISAGGQVEWTTTYGDSGSYSVIVSLSDGLASVLDTASITVANVNRLPVLANGLPDTTIAEMQSLQFTFVASDPDSDAVSFALSAAPDSATLSSGGLFTWTPSYSDSGNHTIVISIGDGSGSVTDTAFVHVVNVNRVPVFLSSLPDTAVLENTTLSFAISGNDPDLDIVSFAKANGPAGLTVSAGGQLEWTTSYADSGAHELIVSLTDGAVTVYDTAKIIVVDVNRLPVVSVGIPDTTIAENQQLEFTIDAADPDGGTLALTLLKAPSGASVTAGGLFSWTPSFLQAGIDTVILGVNDGIDIVPDTAMITVTNVNRLPGAVALLEPTDDDTLQLAVPLMPVNFRWTKSADLDEDDTLSYLIQIVGPGFDTTVVVETDTSASIDIAGRLQASSEYHWTIRITDTHDTVAAPQSFSFRTSATITSVEALGVIPTEFSLGQNFPNPFNPSTTIAYDIPAKSTVIVQVFNMLGQLVSTLVDDEQGAGRYTVTWRGTSQSGASVSSGIYFYRIHAKGGDREFIQTRKLLLLK